MPCLVVIETYLNYLNTHFVLRSNSLSFPTKKPPAGVVAWLIWIFLRPKMSTSGIQKKFDTDIDSVFLSEEFQNSCSESMITLLSWKGFKLKLYELTSLQSRPYSKEVNFENKQCNVSYMYFDLMQPFTTISVLLQIRFVRYIIKEWAISLFSPNQSEYSFNAALVLLLYWN